MCNNIVRSLDRVALVFYFIRSLVRAFVEYFSVFFLVFQLLLFVWYSVLWLSFKVVHFHRRLWTLWLLSVNQHLRNRQRSRFQRRNIDFYGEWRLVSASNECNWIREKINSPMRCFVRATVNCQCTRAIPHSNKFRIMSEIHSHYRPKKKRKQMPRVTHPLDLSTIFRHGIPMSHSRLLSFRLFRARWINVVCSAFRLSFVFDMAAACGSMTSTPIILAMNVRKYTPECNNSIATASNNGST